MRDIYVYSREVKNMTALGKTFAKSRFFQLKVFFTLSVSYSII